MLKSFDSTVFSWTVAFIPYWLFLCGCVWEIVRTITHGFMKNVILKKCHICQLLVMSITISLGFRSTLHICHINIFSNSTSTIYLEKNPWIEWLISIWFLYITFSLTYISKWIDHANRRGFISPLSIERTGSGWEPIPAKDKQRPGVLTVNVV